MFGWLKWAAAALMGAAGAVIISLEAAKVPPPRPDVNLLFVPSPVVTKAVATGYENLVADGLWLGLLQYYGGRLVEDDKRAVNLGPMFELITDLDSRFWFAYWLGAWALADNGEEVEALALLEKGERLNPQDYHYPFTRGFIHFLYEKNYQAAAACFEKTATMAGAPRFAKTMAARIYAQEGREDLALSIWRELYEKSPDRATREIARRNLLRLQRSPDGKGGL